MGYLIMLVVIASLSPIFVCFGGLWLIPSHENDHRDRHFLHFRRCPLPVRSSCSSHPLRLQQIFRFAGSTYCSVPKCTPYDLTYQCTFASPIAIRCRVAFFSRFCQPGCVSLCNFVVLYSFEYGGRKLQT